MRWKALEEWGRNNPVSLAVAALLFGLFPGAVIAAVGGYNLGFYYGTTTSESVWQQSFKQKVKDQVEGEVASKCGQAVSEVNSACQSQVKRLDKAIETKDEELKQRDEYIDSLKTRSDIIELHERLVANAEFILKNLRDAKEKQDQETERLYKIRFFSLLADVLRLNQLYMEWGSLFDGRATVLMQRYNSGAVVSGDEIIGYLEYFSAGADLKRNVIQRQVDEANKIKAKKY